MKNPTSVPPFNVAEHSPVCILIGDISPDSLRGENIEQSLYFQSYKSQEGGWEDTGDHGKQKQMCLFLSFNLEGDLQIIAYAKCKQRTDEKYKWSTG